MSNAEAASDERALDEADRLLRAAGVDVVWVNRNPGALSVWTLRSAGGLMGRGNTLREALEANAKRLRGEVVYQPWE